MDKADSILEIAPFAGKKGANASLFLDAMTEATAFHYKNCADYKKICDSRQFNPLDSKFNLADIPYLPVSIFKKINLVSVPKSEIEKNIISSATTGNVPSSILLDKTTVGRQIKALNAIMSDFIGKERKVFIIFDSEQTVKAKAGQLSSRGSAIRGMLFMARSMHFILREDLTLDTDALKSALSKLRPEDEVCFFGFTWLLYKVISENKAAGMQLLLNKPPLVLHIGGWKKLRDLHVSKPEFNQLASKFFGTQVENVRDIYGMTEQLGTVYIDCEQGYKHVPFYSEIIIRDVNTLEPLGLNCDGFIQLLSPLPHSYPGIAVLSDDIGAVIGEDDCGCGRQGKYFIFKARTEKAELKGCGDTLH